MKNNKLERSSQQTDQKRTSSGTNGQDSDDSDRFKRSFPYSPYDRRGCPIPPQYFGVSGPAPMKGPMCSYDTGKVKDIPRDVHLLEDDKYLNKGEIISAVEFIQKLRQCYSEDSGLYLDFLDMMKEFKHARLTPGELTKKAYALLMNNEELLNEFRKFLPANLYCLTKVDGEEMGPSPSQVDDSGLKMDSDKAMHFVAQVKERLINEPDTYEKFIKALGNLRVKKVPKDKFRELKAILSGYPDLLSNLYRFIPPDLIHEDEEESGPLSMLKKKLKGHGACAEFLKCIDAFNQDLISKKDLIFLLKSIVKDDDLEQKIKKYVGIDDGESNEDCEREMEFLKKVGSYRILPPENKVKFERNGDVLNGICAGCPTHTREDEQYVFLKRNVHEENLFRIEDEMFESDLHILRCDMLIIELEKISHITNEISLSMLNIPSGVVQELLEYIYGEAYEDILDGMLMKPSQVVPIVLKRLYSVNKKWREEKIEKGNIWCEEIGLNYYRALESSFYDFKNADKKSLVYKNLSKSMIGKWRVGNKEVSDCVVELCRLYSENWGLKENNMPEMVEKTLALFNEPMVFYCNPAVFSLISSILIVYDRILDIFELKLPMLTQSKLAIKMGLVKELDEVYTSKPRNEAILSLLKLFIGGKIETNKFENMLRIVSDSNAYKLLDIDKILSKMDSKVAVLRQDPMNFEILMDIFNRSSQKDKVEMLGSDENFVFTISESFVEIEKITHNSHSDDLESVKRFQNLKYDDKSVKRGVFLSRNHTDYNGGVMYSKLEHRVCVKGQQMFFISGTEDFFMRTEYKRGTA